MVNLLADFVARFNVGLRARLKYVYVPYSRVNIKIIRILCDYNCISTFQVIQQFGNSALLIKIVPLYVDNQSIVRTIELISKPGLRVYWSAEELAKRFFRYNFQGFYIVSTSGGLCLSSDLILAHILKKPISGEVLLKLNF